MSTETPRTDAAVTVCACGRVVSEHVAQGIERDLAAACEQIAALTADRDSWAEQDSEHVGELVEAREALKVEQNRVDNLQRILQEQISSGDRSLDAARKQAKNLEEGLRKADQALGIAYDWNLYEIEIDGEMVRTADLQSELRALLAPAAEVTR